MKSNLVKTVIAFTLCGTSALATSNRQPLPAPATANENKLSQSEEAVTKASGEINISYIENIDVSEMMNSEVEIATAAMPSTEPGCNDNEVFTLKMKYADDETAQFAVYDQDNNLKWKVSQRPVDQTARRIVDVIGTSKPIDPFFVCFKRYEPLLLAKQMEAERTCTNLTQLIQCKDLNISFTQVLRTHCASKTLKWFRPLN